MSIVITRTIDATSALAYGSLSQYAVSYSLVGSSTLCCYVNISLCLFKFDLPGGKVSISWGQKSYINFSAILLLILLSLKMECYRFPVLLSYLLMVVRQQSGPNRYFEKLVVNVVKAFFFTAFSLIPPVTNGEGPQEHAHADRKSVV